MTTTLPEIAATPIGTIVRRLPVRVTPETTLGEVVAALREKGATVATGRFRAHMDVELVNDGPTTLLLEV